MRTLFLGTILFFGFVCSAGAAPALLHEQVIAVADDQTVTLAHSGKARFADIVFPDAALAQAWFAGHLLQKEISFVTGDTDRYGRTLITSDTEAEMLRDGVAVLFNQQEIDGRWSAAEASARQAKRGVWANKDFVLTPENAAQHLLSFHVVEGTVKHIYNGPHGTYLNFGDDWHSDFSVTIAGRSRRSFTALLSRIKEGTRVRVRGGLYEENGPMIHVTRPEQLEII